MRLFCQPSNVCLVHNSLYINLYLYLYSYIYIHICMHSCDVLVLLTILKRWAEFDGEFKKGVEECIYQQQNIGIVIWIWLELSGIIS